MENSTWGTSADSDMREVEEMDLEVDSEPLSGDIHLALEMRDKLGIRPSKLPDSPESGLEEKKDLISFDEDPCDGSNPSQTLPDLIANNSAEPQTREGLLPGRQGARRDKVIRNGAEAAVPDDYGDDALAKVDLPGSADYQPARPAVRPKKPILVAAVFPQRASHTASVGSPVEHSPTQERVLTSDEPPSFQPSKPPEPRKEEEEYFDVLLLHSNDDTGHSESFMKLASKLAWKVTAESDFNPNLPKFTAFKLAFQQSSYTVLLLTDNFLNDVWCEMRHQMALVQSIENPEKQYCVIPVVCQSNLKMPMELSVFTSVSSMAPNYERRMTRTIDVNKRRQREKAAGLLPSPSTPTPPISCQQPTLDTAAKSLDEIYLQRRPELDPGPFVSQVFPTHIYRQLCLYLDKEHGLRRNWIMVAEQLGFTRRLIESEIMRRETSPTAAVLECLCQQQLAQKKSKQDILRGLLKILQDGQREDCVQLLIQVLKPTKGMEHT